MSCKFESLSMQMDELNRRIQKTEKLLSSSVIPLDERDDLERDLNALKDALERHRTELRGMRSKRRFMMFATAFLVMAAFILLIAFSKYRSFDDRLPIVTKLT